jgi:ABC-type protease/lipase transport system fused ATPase/permease subunit
VAHIDRLDQSEVTGSSNFKRAFKSVPYNVLSAFIDLTIVFLPIWKLDTFDQTLPSKNTYLISEILSVTSMAEFAMVTSNYRKIFFLIPKSRLQEG